MAEEPQQPEPHSMPKGTLVLILAYLVMLSILWIDAYLTLWLPRGRS